MDISVILNVYKRPHMLKKQIEAIRNQTVKSDIHIWFNEAIPEFMDMGIKMYHANWNTRFWGRFTVPLYLDTPYIAVFDDDVIPGRRWLENCLATINIHNGILGGSGVVLQKKAYVPCNKIGWNGLHSDRTMRVDLVGHAWFFRQEWTKYIWYEKPYTFLNGEDMTFSYLAQKYGKIHTYVPPHPEGDTDLWCTDYNIASEVGCDENSTWKKSNHIPLRNEICAYYIDIGGNPK